MPAKTRTNCAAWPAAAAGLPADSLVFCCAATGISRCAVIQAAMPRLANTPQPSRHPWA